MEARMCRDLFLKDHYGNEYEKEVVTWYVQNLPLIEAYPNSSVMRAVLEAFVADCNMYAIKHIDEHEEWRSLNQQAIENARRRITLLLQDAKNKKVALHAPSTDPLAKRVN